MRASTRSLLAGAVMTVAGLSGTAQAAEPYVIGLTADLSGAASTTYKPLAEGARVYFEQVNADGGINGHPVRLMTRDSHSDPTEVVGDLNYFDSEGVLASVFVSPSGTLGAYVQQNRSLRIPTIYINACYPPATPPAPDPNFFCPGISTLADSYAAVDLMLEMMDGKDVRLALVTTDIPGARGAAEKIMAPYAREQGAEVVDIAVMPLGTTDASSIARNFVDQGVNAVISYTISKHMLAGAEALAQEGWKGKYLLTTGLPGTFNAVEQLKEPNIYGWDHFSLLSEDKPIHREMKAAAEEFGFDFPLSDMRMGYRSAMVLGAALRECGWPCDRDALRETLNHLTVDSQDMVDLNLNPVEFTPTNHTSPEKNYRVYHWSRETGGIAPALRGFTAKERDWQ